MIKKRRVWFAICIVPFLLLTACNSRFFALSDDERRGPSVPLGTQRTTSVDGLTVGDRLMAAGEFQLALDAYRRAAAEDGITSEALSGMGSANLRLGRLNQARTLLDKALESNDQSAAVWNNLGVVLMNQNEPQQAREAFRVAFGIDNGDSELIRQNLILANEQITAQTVEIAELADYSLIRHGNGSYFLLGN